MLKKVLVALVVLVAGLLAFIATRPAEFHIERSATIAAPAAVIYPHVANFRHWGGWSPWEHLDPNMTKTLEGEDAAVGSTYRWAGNDEVGEGRMTIVDAIVDQRLSIELEFIKPFAATNMTTIDLEGQDAGTRVTWSMDGRNGFMAKAMGVFMNMDEMIGKDLADGLANLKDITEAEVRDMPAGGATTP